MISSKSLSALCHRSRLAKWKLLLVGAAMLLGLMGYHLLHADDPAGSATSVAVAKGPMPAGGNSRLEQMARTDHVALLDYCLDHYRGNVVDYTCTFTKQERIGDVLGKEQPIDVRFRQSPFSVAMTWLANPPKADRILYVEGRNDGKMLVRPASRILQALAPQGVWRQPDSEEAKACSLRTVDAFGFERQMVSLRAVYKEAEAGGDLRQEFGGYYRVDGRDSLLITRTLTARKPAYPAQKTNIYIDVDRLVPILMESFGWDDNLLCRYVYTDVRFNVGLTDDGFTPDSIGLKSGR